MNNDGQKRAKGAMNFNEETQNNPYERPKYLTY